MPDLFKHKINYTERFKRRHSLRFHMSLILLATACSGFLATRTMLALHMENVMLRYPLAVVFAYLIFFISIKLWLKYISSTPATQKVHDKSFDLLDVMPDMPISFGGNAQVGNVFHGGGGVFDGGGASDGFGEAASTISDSGTDMLSGAIDTGGGIGDAIGDAAGEAVSSTLGDEGGVVVVLVFAALAAILAVVVGTAAYLVYEAPFILSEAAFEFILAAGLVRGVRRIDSADWMGSVLKTTWIPFAITLALSLFAADLMQNYFPGVTRISELLSRM